DRLAAIDRIILQMAAFEIVHVPTMPRAVVINEAVELAKRFSTDDSAGFINGVLGSVVRGRISS
ncbi:MAG: transcription antitermination protein NusB, partial [Vulcanimicrobiaceae bacterium]